MDSINYYIVVETAYEGAGDNEFQICCVTTDLQEAQQSFDKYKKFCEDNNTKDSSWSYNYQLRRYYKTDNNFFLYQALCECSNV